MEDRARNSLPCSKCRTVLDVSDMAWGNTSTFPCPSCSTETAMTVFPTVASNPLEGLQAETVIFEEEAGCFYHTDNKAVSACESCGRYLCSLCDINFSGQHVCAKCLETSKKKGKNKKIVRSYVLYDEMAVKLSVYSLLPFLWFAAPIMAAAALYLSIRYWKEPCGIIPKSRTRLLIAGILALLEIIAMILLAIFIWHKARS